MAQELLASGFWPCVVLNGGAGEEIDQGGNPTGKIKARITVKIEDGPSKGRVCTYEDEVNARSSLYVARSLKACGWKGKTLGTVADDVAAWVAVTGGRSTVEIKHIPIKNGKRAGEIWDKPNSIGRGPKALAAPAAGSLSDADEAMRRAMADDGGAPPEDDVPPNPSQIASDDIPF